MNGLATANLSRQLHRIVSRLGGDPIALRGRQRSFSLSNPSPRNGNRLAKYAPRPERYATSPSPVLHSQTLRGGTRVSNEKSFETISTQPVSASIQSTPDPAIDLNPNTKNRPTVRWDEIRPALASNGTGSTTGSKKAITGAGQDLQTPVPAMLATTSDEAEPNKVEPMARRKAMTIAGVTIPPKPIPPGEEECCMSGCVNCVYTVYADDLLEYNDTLTTALLALRSSSPPIPLEQWPEEIKAFAARRSRSRAGADARDGVNETGAAIFGRSSEEGMGGDSAVEAVAKDETKEEMRNLLEGVDPSLRAFLEMEARLKAKGSKEAMQPTAC